MQLILTRPHALLIAATIAVFGPALLPKPVAAQFIQQGTKLVGGGAVGAASQGGSVALSGDGNTAIIGGRADNNNDGAAWIFTRSNGLWTQQSKLFGAGAVGNAEQGWSVALSGDGNTAIFGGPNDAGAVGAAWVFTRTNGVWTQQGGKLVGTGVVGGAATQGWSVALSADGNTAIIGGIFDNNHTGAAWVFTRSNGVWTQQGGKLVGTGAVGIAEQGTSVALSGDGNTAIVGGLASFLFVLPAARAQELDRELEAFARSPLFQGIVLDAKGKTVGRLAATAGSTGQCVVVRKIGGVWVGLPIYALSTGLTTGDGFLPYMYQSADCTGEPYFPRDLYSGYDILSVAFIGVFSPATEPTITFAGTPVSLLNIKSLRYLQSAPAPPCQTVGGANGAPRYVGLPQTIPLSSLRLCSALSYRMIRENHVVAKITRRQVNGAGKPPKSHVLLRQALLLSNASDVLAQV
jgi:hypothetical protein